MVKQSYKQKVDSNYMYSILFVEIRYKYIHVMKYQFLIE